MDRTDIAVVGGGIAGASAAYHLATASDRSIAVFERSDLARETTAKSAAFFGYYGSATERRMKRYGMARYNEFFASPRAEPFFDLVGRVRVATTPAAARDLEDRVGDAAAGGDSTTAYLPGSVLRETMLLPEVDAAVVEGALYRPHVGYLDPREMALEFAERARENGATIETGAAVEDVLVEDGSVSGLVVDGDRIDADAVVCAAGPWNPEVAAMVRVDLPVAHTLAPVLELDPGRLGHALPIVSHEETGIYLRGHRGGSVLVGQYPTDPAEETIDPATVGESVPEETRREMWRVIEEILPPLADAEVADEWVGVRSHTPDGHPIAGWTPVDGFSVAAFDSSGIQLAPAVGHVISEQVANGRPTSYHDALSLSRFDDDSSDGAGES